MQRQELSQAGILTPIMEFSLLLSATRRYTLADNLRALAGRQGITSPPLTHRQELPQAGIRMQTAVPLHLQSAAQPCTQEEILRASAARRGTTLRPSMQR